MSEESQTIEQRKVSSIISERLTEAVEDYLDEDIGEILTCYRDGFTVAQVATDILAAIKKWANADTNLEALTLQVEDCADQYLSDEEEF